MFNKERQPEGVENNRASAGAHVTKIGSLENPATGDFLKINEQDILHNTCFMWIICLIIITSSTVDITLLQAC